MSRYTTLVRRLGRRRWFAAVGRRMVPVDRWLQRRTRGRWSVVGRHGLPTLLLTTIGRRSGEPRTQPLLYARDGEGYVVTGSNWGQRHHPAWSANLLAHPDATATIGDESFPVRARLAEDAERDRLWELLLDQWPAYRVYEQRAAGRQIRIFRLARPH